MILKLNFRVEIILLLIILILMVVAPMLLSCTNHSPYKLLEGFVEGFVEGVANTLKEDEDKTLNINTGGMSTSSSSNNNKPTKAKKEGFSNFKKKPDIPLIFNDNMFKPECCPNTYSNSMGCACMTQSQYTYLIERGGNNIPYSEY